MLQLRRRHLSSCSHKSGLYLKCKCPLWAIGTLDGRFLRKSLDTRNLEKATKLVAEMDVSKVQRVSLSEACDRFIADCERRNSADTSAKYRLMIGELKSALGNRDVRAISLDEISRYSEGWKLAPITAGKKLERLRSMFKFFMERGWCSFNPAVGVKKPKVNFQQRMPFSAAEVEKILWATGIYPIKGIYRTDSRLRIRAFVEHAFRWQNHRLDAEDGQAGLHAPS
jgi:site-specific recombinase XerD